MVIIIIIIADIPMILPNDFLPKYSPLIAVVMGARAPNPIPYMDANIKADHMEVTVTARATPMAWRHPNKNIAYRFVTRSPIMPPCN